MLRHFYTFSVLLALLAVLAFAGKGRRPEGGWVSLFNGKDLSGWDTYLAPPTDSNGKRITDQPIGLNNDPQHDEFQVQEGDVGEYWGCAGGMADIPAVKKTDSGYEYNPAGQMYTFSVYNSMGRQSEGAEIFYKQIKIRSIDRILERSLFKP